MKIGEDGKQPNPHPTPRLNARGLFEPYLHEGKKITEVARLGAIQIDCNVLGIISSDGSSPRWETTFGWFLARIGHLRPYGTKHILHSQAAMFKTFARSLQKNKFLKWKLKKQKKTYFCCIDVHGMNME